MKRQMKYFLGLWETCHDHWTLLLLGTSTSQMSGGYIVQQRSSKGVWRRTSWHRCWWCELWKAPCWTCCLWIQFMSEYNLWVMQWLGATLGTVIILCCWRSKEGVSRTVTLGNWCMDFGLYQTLVNRVHWEAVLKCQGIQEGWTMFKPKVQKQAVSMCWKTSRQARRLVWLERFGCNWN